MREMAIKVRYFDCKKKSLLGTNVVQVKKELRMVDIVKVEKDVKSKSELGPTSVGKVKKISPWI
jgi:hypothetical protein